MEELILHSRRLAGPLARAVKDYQPKEDLSLDDLSRPVTALLHRLPGVASADDRLRAKGRPSHRIIHLLDWHFLPKKVFAADVRDVAGRLVSDKRIDELFREHQLEVSLVQMEQRAVLECLIEHHGLTRIFQEGLTADDMPVYRLMIASLRQFQAAIPDLLKQRDKAGRERRQQIDALLAAHHVDMLKVGAPGQLLVAGRIDEVAPLDNAQQLKRANPVGKDGKVILDAKFIEAREDGQADKLLKTGRFSLVVLGGGHDLADNLQFSTKAYRDFGPREAK